MNLKAGAVRTAGQRSEPDGNAGRLPNVELVRGLAALAVTWFHLTNSYPDGWVRASGSYGWLGVEAFFVISGFVLPYSLHRSQYKLSDFGRFMLRRLIRLEPPYVASVLLVVVLAWLSFATPGFRGLSPNFELGQILAHLLYLVPVFGYDWVSPVYWTLFFEFSFYVVLGLIFPVVASRSALPFALLGFCAMVIVSFVAAGNSVTVFFIMGIVAFRSFRGLDSPTTTSVLLTASVLFSCRFTSSDQTIVGTAVTILLLLRINLKLSIPLAFLGTISYSLYLIHVPIGGRIVNLGSRLGSGPIFEVALSLSALVVCLVFSWLFWRLVEKPAHAAAKRLPLKPR